MSDIYAALTRAYRSPAFKFFVIAFLVMLLLIPLFSVWGLIEERERRARGVEREIGQLWGAQQTAVGPFLVVPYTVRVVRKTGKEEAVVNEERHAVFTPESLNIAADVSSQIRSRGIYDVPVYEGRFVVSGKFAKPDIKQVEATPLSVRWSDAIIALSLSDVSGLKSATKLTVEGAGAASFEPSFGIPGDGTIGIHVPVSRIAGLLPAPSDDASKAGAAPRAFSFSFPLELAGSLELRFAPAARQTVVELKSDWPHPSFSGAFLPIKRDISSTGFSARWQVPDLARSVPPAWAVTTNPRFRTGAVNDLNRYQFGVRFFVPVDFYNLAERAVKYGFLFVAITFAAVFVIELLSGRRFHAVQYIMVGIAAIFFFVLLLSFAEHLGFLPAYLLAATATGTMLSTYIARALESRWYGIIMLSVFVILYALLYVILTLEDYALLVGALAGFSMLAGVMFLTLRVDWSGGRAVPAE